MVLVSAFTEYGYAPLVPPIVCELAKCSVNARSSSVFYDSDCLTIDSSFLRTAAETVLTQLL